MAKADRRAATWNRGRAEPSRALPRPPCFAQRPVVRLAAPRLSKPVGHCAEPAASPTPQVAQWRDSVVWRAAAALPSFMELVNALHTNKQARTHRPGSVFLRDEYEPRSRHPPGLLPVDNTRGRLSRAGIDGVAGFAALLRGLGLTAVRQRDKRRPARRRHALRKL